MSGTGTAASRCHYDIEADASAEEIEALVAQSQRNDQPWFDVVTNPTSVTVSVN